MKTPARKTYDQGISAWLGGLSLTDWLAQFDKTGYLVFENVLDRKEIERIRAALQPHLDQKIQGRNDFEGMKTNRVYGLLAKSSVFADLVMHPLPLAFAEAELGSSCLLSACLAINLLPGESTQPWHHDDGHIDVPLPHPPWGLSAFWAIDDTTTENGATEIIPGSHHWSAEQAAANLPGKVKAEDISKPSLRAQDDDPGQHPDALKVVMPAGSLMVAKGTLWHRGGANKSTQPRLIVTPQYCPGWARQLENMIAMVPRDIAATYPKRVRELIGYSIHEPIMGYVDGVHPQKLLD